MTLVDFNDFDYAGHITALVACKLIQELFFLKRYHAAHTKNEASQASLQKKALPAGGSADESERSEGTFAFFFLFSHRLVAFLKTLLKTRVKT